MKRLLVLLVLPLLMACSMSIGETCSTVKIKSTVANIVNIDCSGAALSSNCTVDPNMVLGKVRQDDVLPYKGSYHFVNSAVPYYAVTYNGKVAAIKADDAVIQC